MSWSGIFILVSATLLVSQWLLDIFFFFGPQRVCILTVSSSHVAFWSLYRLSGYYACYLEEKKINPGPESLKINILISICNQCSKVNYVTSILIPSSMDFVFAKRAALWISGKTFGFISLGCEFESHLGNFHLSPPLPTYSLVNHHSMVEKRGLSQPFHFVFENGDGWGNFFQWKNGIIM